ncbi:MAG: hypothetical protein H9893_13880 [Candidatus Niameybacter stercoravium]|nr:hypothetical protein [Candidatus Niameybacter stercoravium]
MKMLFKQRFFSWFDSYDIYGEDGSVLYTVKGKMAWGHCLEVYNAKEEHIATLKEEVFTWMPRFRIYLGDNYVGDIKKEFTFFKPSFSLDYNGWNVTGDFFDWDYEITEGGSAVAWVSKQLFNFTDTYTIEVAQPENALICLMIVLAIDAAKCSANKS